MAYAREANACAALESFRASRQASCDRVEATQAGEVAPRCAPGQSHAAHREHEHALHVWGARASPGPELVLARAVGSGVVGGPGVDFHRFGPLWTSTALASCAEKFGTGVAGRRLR